MNCSPLFNSILWATQIFACFFMTGLIWLVQLVHYPAYRFIDPQRFAAYQKFHTSTITYIVGPVMVLELLSGLWLCFCSRMASANMANLFGIGLIWLVTAVLSVSAHQKLMAGLDLKQLRNLLLLNWVRTGAWTARSAFIFYFLIKR